MPHVNNHTIADVVSSRFHSQKGNSRQLGSALVLPWFGPRETSVVLGLLEDVKNPLQVLKPP